MTTNQSIYQIELRHYPDIQETYKYFHEKWNGFSNSAKFVYFTDKEDVLKFVHEYEFQNSKDWFGEEKAREQADIRIAQMREHQSLEKLNSLYRVYPCGSLDISEIRINDLQMVLESPLMNTRSKTYE